MRGTREFTDLVEVNTLELPKIPHNTDGTALWDWLKFLAVREEEELKMLTEKNPQIGKAVARLQELSEDERTRLLAESREKWEWDMQAIREKGFEKGREAGLEAGLEEGLEKGREKGLEEALLSVAQIALKKNMPIEEIMALTGLSREKILSLPH